MSLGSSDAPQQEESPMEKEQQQMAEDTWARYKEKFIPLEEATLEKIRSWDSAGYRDNQIGEAVAVARRLPFDGTQPAMGGGTSGDFLASLMQHNAQSDAMAAQGAAETNQLATEKYLGGLMDMVQLGNNQRISAAGLSSNLSSIQAQEARRDALMEVDEQRNMMSGIGTLAGVGTSYLSPMTNRISLGTQEGYPSFVGPPSNLANPIASAPAIPTSSYGSALAAPMFVH